MHDEDKKVFEQQYRTEVEEKLRFFVRKNLFDPIKEYQIFNNWIKQFPDGSLTPYFLLDALIVLTYEQVKASLKNILEQIKASIYQKNPTLSDEELFDAYDAHLEESVFVCACTQGQMAGGAPETMHRFREVVGGDKFHEVAVVDLCQALAKDQIKHVYIVDDFIGTGKTIRDQILQKYSHDGCVANSNSLQCSIKCAADHHPNVHFTVVSVILHETGAKKIEREFKGFNLLTAYSIDNSYNLFSEECVLYRDENYIKKIIADIEEISEKHQMTDNKYAQYLPLSISECFPNNSLELFWWKKKSSEWTPLIARQN